MSFAKRIYVPGEVPDQTDLNRIGNGIAAVSAEIDEQAAAMRQNADAKIGMCLRTDGSKPMTGSLPVPTGIVELPGGTRIDGKYNGNSLNVEAPDLRMNGVPVISNWNSGMSACLLSLVNYKTPAAATAYAQFSAITNLGTTGAPPFEIYGSERDQIRLVDTIERNVLIIMTVYISGIASSGIEGRLYTSHGATITGASVASRMADAAAEYACSAVIVKMSQNTPTNIRIRGYGRTITAYVTAMTLD